MAWNRDRHAIRQGDVAEVARARQCLSFEQAHALMLKQIVIVLATIAGCFVVSAANVVLHDCWF